VKRWLSWSHAWCHKIVLERRQSIAPKLLDLEQAGDLTILDNDAMDDALPSDIAQILALIERIKGAGLLCAVAVDPAGIGDMIEALAEIGITPENRERGYDYVVGAPQGYALMNAIKTAERKLAHGALLHADQALMDWCVGNLKIEPTATAIRATKQTRRRRQDRPGHGPVRRRHRHGHQPRRPPLGLRGARPAGPVEAAMKRSDSAAQAPAQSSIAGSGGRRRLRDRRRGPDHLRRGLIYRPAAFIVAGGFLLAGAWLLARKGV
jgi:hypothetical protein